MSKRALSKADIAFLNVAGDLEMAQERLKTIAAIIIGVENRCMAADGPVTNTRDEMTDNELRRIYNLASGNVS